MDEFILIMRHEDGSKIASPEQIKIWMEQTMAWMAGITPPSEVLSGTGLLFEHAKVVESNKTVRNGPFGATRETIGGFIIIRAESAEAAVDFARGCPVLQGTGNSVEVRKIAHGDGIH